MPSILSFMSGPATSNRKTAMLGAVGVAVLASVAVIGVPAGWYRHSQPVAAPQTETVAGTSTPEPSQPPAQTQPAEPAPTEESRSAEDAQTAARRQREKERRQREDKALAASQLSTLGAVTPAAAESNKPGAKKVVVTVTYDESGRVTQASGGDANAMRIARQKRFPAGKAGSATITIPLN